MEIYSADIPNAFYRQDFSHLDSGADLARRYEAVSSESDTIHCAICELIGSLLGATTALLTEKGPILAVTAARQHLLKSMLLDLTRLGQMPGLLERSNTLTLLNS
jgi:hypothetical protein